MPAWLTFRGRHQVPDDILVMERPRDPATYGACSLKATPLAPYVPYPLLMLLGNRSGSRGNIS